MCVRWEQGVGRKTPGDVREVGAGGREERRPAMCVRREQGGREERRPAMCVRRDEEKAPGTGYSWAPPGEVWGNSRQPHLHPHPGWYGAVGFYDN